MNSDTRPNPRIPPPPVQHAASQDLQKTTWRWLRVLLRNRSALVGAMLVLGMTVMALVAPLVVPYDPTYLKPEIRLSNPSQAHFFGTDDFGRDVFSLVIYGSRVSMFVGFLVMLCSSLAGIVIGLLAGYYRSLDNMIMRLLDGLMSFPAILLAIALMASRGPGVFNVIVALSVVYMPRMARIIRSTVLVARELTYVEAARALGAWDVKIALRHILPNCLPPLIVQGTFIFAYSILAEAILGFLGVGVPPYIPSWGNVISSGKMFIRQAPWISLFPGLAIILAGLGLNLVGDGLRDALDPRMRDISMARQG